MSKPARIISLWSPILLNRKHVSLSGEDQYGEHWVSTTLAELDVENRTARTISGRPYKLHGDPDPDYALRQALSILSRTYDLEGSTVEAISIEDADAWLRGLPAKPQLSPDDRIANEEHRRRQTWGMLQWHAVESGLSDVEVAEVTGLPLDVIVSLHRGVVSLGDVPTGEVEEGLGRLRNHRERGWRL